MSLGGLSQTWKKVMTRVRNGTLSKTITTQPTRPANRSRRPANKYEHQRYGFEVFGAVSLVRKSTDGLLIAIQSVSVDNVILGKENTIDDSRRIDVM